MSKAYNFLLILSILFTQSVNANDDYARAQAIEYLKKGIYQQYDIGGKIKVIEKQSYAYVRRTFTDDYVFIPNILIGTGSQFFLAKKIAFRGKTPLIGNHYELQILTDYSWKLKLSGQNPFFTGDYWLSTASNSSLSAGLIFRF